MNTFIRCLETIWKDNLQNASITPSNCLCWNFWTRPEIVLKIEKNSRIQNVFISTSSYAAWIRLHDVLLEMLPSRRLHNAFKRLKWKCFMDIQKMSSRLKKKSLQNVFITTSSHKIWSRLQCVFKIFQWKGPQTSLWHLQIINILKMSSTGL